MDAAGPCLPIGPGKSAPVDEEGQDEPEFGTASIQTLRTRLAAVSAACDRAEAEARHVVDDEVYVSVGLIRNALNGPEDNPGVECAECHHSMSEHGKPTPYGSECIVHVGQGDWCGCRNM